MKNLEMLLNEILTIEEGSELQKIYKDIFIDECSEYENIEEIKKGINNGCFCCVNGCIGALIYYYQTEEIFKNNFNEVLEMTQEVFEGYKIDDIELSANNLIWTTFEYMVDNWYYDIENYIDNSNID